MENKSYEVIINGVGKNITREEDKDAIEKIFNNYKTDSLILRTVGQICESQDNFYIANYQRGYRWGKDEVEALLKDIYEVYKKDDREQKYCLQPLVVKKRKDQEYTRTLKNLIEGIGKQDNKLEQEAENQRKVDGEIYELLDGQQRLTTLWLILSELERNQKTEGEKESENKTYQIYYELLRRVDKDFIEQASGIIKNWIEKDNPEGKNLNKSKYRDVILGNLTFLWYEVTNGISKVDESTDQNVGNNDSEKLFRKINKGKIELTNAELFKAMLLNDENARTGEERRELERISFEWDKIEQSLRNDEFWFFISNDHSEERTRIDYILEVYARSLEVYARSLDKEKKYSIEKERYSFLVVQEKLKNETNGFSGIKKVWRDIVHVHDKLYSWYQDNELYHNIGFLVASEGKRRAIASETMVELYKKSKEEGINKTKEIAKGEIYDRLIIKKWNYEEQRKGKKKVKKYDIDLSEKYDVENLNYESDDKKYLVAFLLYSNIYSLRQQGKTRFPFKSYYEGSWDIEHINPQTSKTGIIDNLINCGSESIALIWQYLEKVNLEAVKGVTEKDEAALRNIWKDEYLKDGDDSIGNLVLLNSKINRAYHNALFNQKRAKIIEYDKNGEFIPLTTKNVFLKYYTKNPSEFIRWDDDDREGYMSYLKTIFDEIVGWSKYSQKNKTEL